MTDLQKEIEGQVFGRLRAIREVEPRMSKYGKRRVIECTCECGNRRGFLLDQLRGGKTRSCGCLKSEMLKKRFFKHGQIHSPEYSVWAGIKDRCFNPVADSYRLYGERGITMSDEWRNSFPTFLNDMGKRPSKNHQIDRIDNDGNYCKENCRWATQSENQRNRRSNFMITYNGETHCLQEWADMIGIKWATLRHRIVVSKWPLEKAMVPFPHPRT